MAWQSHHFRPNKLVCVALFITQLVTKLKFFFLFFHFSCHDKPIYPRMKNIVPLHLIQVHIYSSKEEEF